MKTLKILPFLITLCVVAALCAACISSKPAVRYTEHTNFSVAYLFDGEKGTTAMPQKSAERLDRALGDRNIRSHRIDENKMAEDFSKLTVPLRISLLRTANEAADARLLINAQAEFYSLLSGRYRWNVKVSFDIEDRNRSVSLHDSFTLPSVLTFAHENEIDAVENVAEEIAARLGVFVDNYMNGIDKVSKVSTEAPADATTPPPTDNNAEPATTESSQIASFYFVLLDRFRDGNKDNNFDVDKNNPEAWHGGDLAGLIEKLPYLKNLGIDALWISPVFHLQRSEFLGHGAFHGYWTYDLSRIEAGFGNEADLKTLIAEAKKHKIKIVLDFVVNHVGYESPLLKTHPEYFHTLGTIKNWNDVKELTEGEVHGLPDLNQDRPEVYAMIENAAKKWFDFDIDGLRLDAVKHVSVDFWHKFNTALKTIRPDAILLGEDFNGSPKQVEKTLRDGNFSHIFDFPSAFAIRDIFCDKQSVGQLAAVLSNDRVYENADALVTFIDNHDMPRFMSECEEDAQKLENALKVLYTVRGTPCLYYGTEIALTGKEEPHNRKDMIFENAENHRTYKVVKDLIARKKSAGKAHTSVLHFDPGLLVLRLSGQRQDTILAISSDPQHRTMPLPAGEWRENGRLVNQISVTPFDVKIFDGKASGHKDKTTLKTIAFVADNPAPNAVYALVGSAPEIGFWDPFKAPRLSAENGYKITLELPENVVIAYKTVKIDGDKTIWENGNNHYDFVRHHNDVLKLSVPE